MKLPSFHIKRNNQEPDIELLNRAESMNVMETAEEAASIVESALEENDMSSISSVLSRLASKPVKEQLVYPAPETNWVILLEIFLAVFSIGFIYLLAISAGTIALSSQYRILGIAGAVVSLVALGLNILVVKRCVSNTKLYRRYEKYRSIMHYKTIEIVEDIAEYAKVPIDRVRRDLQIAIDRKWIPQGHYGTNQSILILSDKTYRQYLENQISFDNYYEKLIEEHRRLAERPPEVSQLLSIGEHYLDKIRSSEESIKDKAVSKTLVEMHRIVSSIFHEVDLDPLLTDQLGELLNYYLPTTEKLLDVYIDLINKKVQVKSIQESKKEIVKSLNLLNRTYENILDRFFKEKEISLAGEAASLKQMVLQEESIDEQDRE